MNIIRGYSLDPEIQVGFCGDLHQRYQQYYEMVEGRILAQRRISRGLQIQTNQSPELDMNSKRRHISVSSRYEKQNAEATRNSLLQRMGRA